MVKNKKIFGVIEGFYGRHYSFTERCDLIKFLSELGLNTYVYAPKDDPYHRREYFKIYPLSELKEFENLNKLARRYEVDFNYAISPGTEPMLKALIKKIASMMEIDIRHFSILFDDIKIKLDSNTALVQVKCANEVWALLKDKWQDAELFFCPTQYYGFNKTEYITTIAENLNKEIKIFWTGRWVIASKITVEDINNITQILTRPPLIWDNIFANDYLPGIILKFPYRNREPRIVEKVCGILLNPMNQYLQSKPLIFTAAEFFKNPFNYSPKYSWRKAKMFY
ncbi:MAG: beta-N-acetylglucosaminidase domain-containing protein [candidate division WOR-3 bacterium]